MSHSLDQLQTFTVNKIILSLCVLFSLLSTPALAQFRPFDAGNERVPLPENVLDRLQPNNDNTDPIDCDATLTGTLCLDEDFIDTCITQNAQDDLSAEIEQSCGNILAELQNQDSSGLSKRLMSNTYQSDQNGTEYPYQSRIHHHGMESTYMGEVANIYSTPVNAQDESLHLNRQWTQLFWDVNCSIQSCEEYVFEKFYDLSIFEKQLKTIKDKPREIFNLFYGSRGIARKTLRSFTGRDIGQISLTGKHQGQNSYIAVRQLYELFPIDWRLIWLLGGFPTVISLVDYVEQADITLNSNLRFSNFILTPALIFQSCEININTALIECSDPDQMSDSLRSLVGQINEQVRWFNEDLLSHTHQPDEVLDVFPPTDTDPWDWHQNMSALLNHVSDDRLIWLQKKQKDFRQVVSQYRSKDQAIRTLFDEVLREILCDQDRACPDAIHSPEEIQTLLIQLLHQRAALIQSVNEGLEQGLSYGCLEENGVTPCDWSPTWLIEDVSDFMITSRAHSYQTCIRNTSNRFDQLHDVAPHQDPNLWLNDSLCEDLDQCQHLNTSSYIRDEASIERYFDLLYLWISQLDLPRDPSTGKPFIGESSSDRGNQGDSSFKMIFQLDVAWKMRDVEEEEREDNTGINQDYIPTACQDGLLSSLGVDLDIVAFGYDIANLINSLSMSHNNEILVQDQPSLMNATIMAQSEDDIDPELQLNIELMGRSIYTSPLESERGSNGSSWIFNFIEQPRYGDRFSDQKIFQVGVIPVTVKGGFAGSVGLLFTLRGEIEACSDDQESLTVDADIEIRPYANASAFLAGAIGIPGFSIGLRADLTLIEFALPFYAELKLDTALQELTTTSRLDLELTALKGSVSIVLELLLESWKYVIFTFNGLKWQTNLLDNSYRFNYQTVRNILIDPSSDSQSRDLSEVNAETYGVPFDCNGPIQIPDPSYYVNFNEQSSNLEQERIIPVIGSEDDALQVMGPLNHNEGIVGQGLELHDSNQAVSLFSPVAFPDRRSLTYSLWFKPEISSQSSNTQHTVLAGRDFKVGYQDDHYIFAEMTCEGVTENEVLFFSVSVNQWTHFMVTYDHINHKFTLFQNTFPIYQKECELPAIPWLTLGGSGFNATDLMQGVIDELAIWHGLLDQDTRLKLYDLGLASLPVYGDDLAQLAHAQDFHATSETFGLVQLTWSAPPSLTSPNYGYDFVSIRASDIRFPAFANEGEEIFRGSDHQQAHDAPVVAGQVRYYTLFAHLNDGRTVRGPSTMGTVSLNSRSPVTNASISAENGFNQLIWTNPNTLSFEKIIIRRSIFAYPLSMIGGSHVYQGRAERIQDLDVMVNTHYYYSLFTVDALGITGDPVTLEVTTPTEYDEHASLDARIPPQDVLITAIDSFAPTISITWDLPIENDLSHIEVLRIGEMGRTQTILQALETSVHDQDISIGQAYTYLIYVYDTAGNRSAGIALNLDVQSQDQNIVTTSFTIEPVPLALELHWNSDDLEEDQEVIITRSTLRFMTTPNSGEIIYQGRDNAYIDTSLSEQYTYFYSLFVVNNQQEYSTALQRSARPLPLHGILGMDQNVQRGQWVWLTPNILDPIEDDIQWQQTQGPHVNLIMNPPYGVYFKAPDQDTTLNFQFQYQPLLQSNQESYYDDLQVTVMGDQDWELDVDLGYQSLSSLSKKWLDHSHVNIRSHREWIILDYIADSRLELLDPLHNEVTHVVDKDLTLIDHHYTLWVCMDRLILYDTDASILHTLDLSDRTEPRWLTPQVIPAHSTLICAEDRLVGQRSELELTTWLASDQGWIQDRSISFGPFYTLTDVMYFDKTQYFLYMQLENHTQGEESEFEIWELDGFDGELENILAYVQDLGSIESETPFRADWIYVYLGQVLAIQYGEIANQYPSYTSRLHIYERDAPKALVTNEVIHFGSAGNDKILTHLNSLYMLNLDRVDTVEHMSFTSYGTWDIHDTGYASPYAFPNDFALWPPQNPTKLWMSSGHPKNHYNMPYLRSVLSHHSLGSQSPWGSKNTHSEVGTNQYIDMNDDYLVTGTEDAITLYQIDHDELKFLASIDLEDITGVQQISIRDHRIYLVSTYQYYQALISFYQIDFTDEDVRIISQGSQYLDHEYFSFQWINDQYILTKFLFSPYFGFKIYRVDGNEFISASSYYGCNRCLYDKEFNKLYNNIIITPDRIQATELDLSQPENAEQSIPQRQILIEQLNLPAHANSWYADTVYKGVFFFRTEGYQEASSEITDLLEDRGTYVVPIAIHSDFAPQITTDIEDPRTLIGTPIPVPNYADFYIQDGMMVASSGSRIWWWTLDMGNKAPLLGSTFTFRNGVNQSAPAIIGSRQYMYYFFSEGIVRQGKLAYVMGDQPVQLLNLKPVRLIPQKSTHQSPGHTKWRVDWIPQANTDIQCWVSLGQCDVISANMETGTAELLWNFSEAGTASIQVVISDGTNQRIATQNIMIQNNPTP